MADAAKPGIMGTKQAVQSFEMQEKTRRQRRFSETEASLPDVTQHVHFKPPGGLSFREAVSDKLQDVLSYLGTHNPLPIEVASDDAVWIMDNVAFEGPRGSWEAEFVAAVFAQHASCRVADAVASVADKLDLEGSEDVDKANATIEERLMPFLQDILPGHVVHALHGDHTHLTFSPGGRNGISSDVRELPASPPGTIVPTIAEVPAGTNGLLEGKTFFSAPDGWGLISDIDDTIKITQTSDPIGILKTTFLDDPTPTKGMPELYRHIQSRITKSSPFFYLSASPYNLYPFLRGFRDKYYPHGTFILRDASWRSVPGLLSNLTLGTHEYKVDRMQKIHSWLPRKKMICIGDSTQADPESYGDIYRAFPGWVHLILIRKVTDISSVGIKEKNEPERFEKAFEDVPRDVWHVFEDPNECFDLVDKATSA